MSESYAKLFSTIVTSTIWGESPETCKVWVTMLAVADRNGVVGSSVPGLARMAVLPLDAVERALARLASPDPYSRTPDFEGRRIEAVDGGWQLLNHKKYREKLGKEERRRQQAEWVANKREKARTSGKVDKPARNPSPHGDTPEDGRLSTTNVDKSTKSTHAPTDAPTDAEEAVSITTEARHTPFATNSAGGVCEAGSFEGHAERQPRPMGIQITPEVVASIALRKLGLRVTAQHPDLIAAIAEGVKPDHLVAFAELYPDKPAGYVIAAARREHAAAAQAPGATHAAPHARIPSALAGEAACAALDELERNQSDSDIEPDESQLPGVWGQG